MRKIINFIILVTFLLITTAYPSALRLPVGRVEQGRIEKAEARELLSQKLAQQNIAVEDCRFERGQEFSEGVNPFSEFEFEEKPGKVITRTQFESAVKEVIKILSAYPDFVVVYSDFIFASQRVLDRALSTMNTAMGGIRDEDVYVDVFTLLSPSSIQIKPAGEQRTTVLPRPAYHRDTGKHDVKPRRATKVEPVAEAYSATTVGEYDRAFNLMIDSLLGRYYVADIDTAITTLKSLKAHYGMDSYEREIVKILLTGLTKHKGWIGKRLLSAVRITKPKQYDDLREELRYKVFARLVEMLEIDRGSIESHDFTVARAHWALKVIVRIGEPLVGYLVHQLNGLLANNDRKDRYEFITGALLKIGGRETTLTVLRELVEGSFGRGVQISLLGQLHDEEAILPLIESLDDAEVTSQAVHSIQRMFETNEALVTNYIMDVLLHEEKHDYEGFYITMKEKARILLTMALRLSFKSDSVYTYLYFRHILLTTPDDTEIFYECVSTILDIANKIIDVNKFGELKDELRNEIIELRKLSKKQERLIKQVLEISGDEIDRRMHSIGKKALAIIRRKGDIWKFKKPIPVISCTEFLKLRNTSILFFDTGIIDYKGMKGRSREGEFRSLLDMVDKSNAPVILLTKYSEAFMRQKLETVSSFKGVEFKTLEQLGLQEADLDQAMSLISGVSDVVRCAPLTKSLYRRFKDLEKIRDQV